MSEQEPARRGRRDVVIAAAITAVVGAIATIVAALIGHAQGKSEAAPAPTVTATTTVTARPTATVTVSGGTSSAGGGSTGQASFAGARITNMEAQFNPGFNDAGIDLDKSMINYGGQGAFLYNQNASNSPILQPDAINSYSLHVTSQDASQAVCKTAVSQYPDQNAITGLRKGLLVCVDTGNGIAILEITRNLDSANDLYVRDIYWANPTPG
jgi:hypothetical protein